MKNWLLALLFSGLCYTTAAQSDPAILQPGQLVPDISLTCIINNATSLTSLAEGYKGKLLILDFFATWCKPCTAQLSKLQCLQRKFASQLQIIVVTQQPDSVIRKFLGNKMINLPFITDDTLLQKMFPHTLLPHEVWIDSSGMVKAITSHKEVNTANITAVLQGKKVILREKKDLPGFDIEKPLFVNGNGGDGNSFMYRSVMAKGNRSLPAGSYGEVDTIRQFRRFVAFNTTALDLFHTAYARGSYALINHKRMVMDVKDTSKYLYTGNTLYQDAEEWFWDHAVTYELTLPAPVPDSTFFGYMLQDLNRLFPLKGRVEKRLTDCWVLSLSGKDTGLLRTSGGRPQLVTEGKVLKQIRNKPLDALLQFLMRYKDMEPVLNETGITQPVDLDIDLPFAHQEFFDWVDMPALQNRLEKYGLRLALAPRMTDILVLTDK